MVIVKFIGAYELNNSVHISLYYKLLTLFYGVLFCVFRAVLWACFLVRAISLWCPYTWPYLHCVQHFLLCTTFQFIICVFDNTVYGTSSKTYNYIRGTGDCKTSIYLCGLKFYFCAVFLNMFYVLNNTMDTNKHYFKSLTQKVFITLFVSNIAYFWKLFSVFV